MAQLKLQVMLDMIDKASPALKRVRGLSAGTGKGLDALRGQLKQLNSQQRALDGMRKQQDGFKKLSNDLSIAKQNLDSLRISGSASAAQIKKQQSVVDQLTAKYGKQRTALTQHRTAMTAMGIGKASDAQATLKNRIDATTKAIEKQANTQRRLDAARSASDQGMLRGAGIAGTGAASIYAGRRTFDTTRNMLMPGMSFDAEMSRTQALARLDKDSKEMQAIRKQARDLGSSTMFSATEVAQGQSFLAMAGFKPEAITGAMPGLLDLSKAGDTELGRTADISSNILSAYGIDPTKMEGVADVLTKGITTSNMNLEMLGNTISYVGPVAKAANVDLETTVALAGLLGNVGIQGDKAGTAMRAALLRLSAPTGAAQKRLNALNVETKDGAGNMLNLVEVLADVAKQTEKMGSADRMAALKDIFGEEPAAAMSELIAQSGSGGIVKYLQEIRDNAGAAGRTAAIMADNLTGDWDEITSAWEDVGIGLFETNKTEFRAWAKTIVSGVTAIGKWFNEHPEISKWLVRGALGFAALTTAMGALLIPLGIMYAKGMLLRFLLIKMGTSLGGLFAWGTRIWPVLMGVGRGFIFIASKLTPMGWAFSLLTIAATMLYEKWDEVVAGGKLLWADLSNFLTTVFDSAINYLTVTLPEKFKNIGAEMINGLKAGITERWARVKDEIGMLADVDIIGYWKDKFGIRSPSRVFMGLGGHMTDGLALGLERGAQAVKTATAGLAAAGTMSLASASAVLPPLDWNKTGALERGAQAVRAPSSGLGPAGTVSMVSASPIVRPLDLKMTDGLERGAQKVSMASATPMLPPLTAQSTAPQEAGSTYNITINAAPGMDAQAIAAAVRAELDKRDRQQGSRKFSSLQDWE